MLNKDIYVPWSFRLLRYAKSKPNGKLNYNSIMNGPYVRRMIPEPEVKQMEVNDQAIQIILMGLPKDIYVAVDSCELLRKSGYAEVNELRAERLARAHDPLALMRISSNPHNRQMAQPGMNLGQDRQMQMVRGNGGINLDRDLDEIKEVNAKCILMTNLQQASTSGTQIDKALVYDSDGSAE
nr:hypothetical protein [Tanacetum cinerariifolium]